MKVILTERVPKLGNVGEIVKVSAGHARNFLIPNRMAVIADAATEKQLVNSKKGLSKKISEQKNVALETKKKLEGITIEMFKKVGGSGKLFGTVTNVELSTELAQRGVDVERRLIVIEKPIKSLGQFEVKAKLFAEVEATFKVKVMMDPEQLKEEKKRLETLSAKKKEKKDKGDKKDKDAKGENAKDAEETSADAEA
ncbi:MAG: 50S ribosomal protein L9 [Bdellovibrionales bacterium RIFOXYD12_FULL_39_22]|nr:MAG: 50S ribosomal protein L9 [Bdellovibrionales bacterium RIFOXYB1_FULL_39_21]OFZ43393.1 MAG: 50S ribosomal protein L9 [Bdellovibrionales bacterium RIFOXYC12_FULL_39_17]OFZ47382.1 MAG: 50S ribosomal protein L9 [Bdellovibrionales bacterium RIFOXYC1_FULL_39_130]OFZ76262.1 MAG: 50S ribosomal protein L9 [Bdellovibrionales bacterium RIFOXYD1_FULL_39_84]OFZ76950.1 MAG: 50S ribosomal protein L9 [Bdellovibrionales bacterium RIFOXYC2_FULL_39_8]OFZ94300.1 MAG: 50S ribosomal protein L9 [Bdellovibrion